MSLDRPPGVSQRAFDIQQVHLTGESAAIIARRRADALERMRRDKIKQDRERKRREFEHHADDGSDKDEPEEGTSFLDVVA